MRTPEVASHSRVLRPASSTSGTSPRSSIALRPFNPLRASAQRWASSGTVCEVSFPSRRNFTENGSSNTRIRNITSCLISIDEAAGEFVSPVHRYFCRESHSYNHSDRGMVLCRQLEGGSAATLGGHIPDAFEIDQVAFDLHLGKRGQHQLRGPAQFFGVMRGLGGAVSVVEGEPAIGGAIGVAGEDHAGRLVQPDG